MEPSNRAREGLVDAAWTEQFIAVNGVRLHVVQSGPADGPLVLLLHGFPAFSYSWRFQLSGLASRFRLAAPDLRGYNLSDKPATGYDIATLTDDIRELILALGQPRAIVVGHDWGGIIAWALAVRHPDVVRKLAILNAPHPGTFRREAFDPRQVARSSYIAFFQLPGIAERALARDDYAMVRRTFRAADRDRAWLADDDIQRYVEAISRPGALGAALEYYRQLPRALHQLTPMRVITAATLVLWGELDPYLGLGFLDGLDRWVRDLQIQRFPTGGHFLHEQLPAQVNAALAAFGDIGDMGDTGESLQG